MVWNFIIFIKVYIFQYIISWVCWSGRMSNLNVYNIFQQTEKLTANLTLSLQRQLLSYPKQVITFVLFIEFCREVTALTQLWLSKPYRTNSQILQCICPISHNAPFCNRNVHTSVTKWCIVGYFCNALWDLWDGSIVTYNFIIIFSGNEWLVICSAHYYLY